MLTITYLFNVFAVGYLVYALERAFGTCMEYIAWCLIHMHIQSKNQKFKNFQIEGTDPRFSKILQLTRVKVPKNYHFPCDF